MIDLVKLQREQAEWAEKNFGDSPPWHPLLGAGEELGELYHAFLKKEQGIRGTEVEHWASIRDAVGDTVIYLMHFCSKVGIDFEAAVRDTWNEVRLRDWAKNKETGQ